MVVEDARTIDEMNAVLQNKGSYILKIGKRLTTTEIHGMTPDCEEFVDTIYVLLDPNDNTMWNLRTRMTDELHYMDLFELTKDTWHRPLKYDI